MSLSREHLDFIRRSELDSPLNESSLKAKALSPILKLKAYMRDLEVKKYPQNIYEAKRVKMLDERRVLNYVLHVRHTGKKLAKKDLEHIERNALAIRKLSIIGGVMEMAGRFFIHPDIAKSVSFDSDPVRDPALPVAKKMCDILLEWARSIESFKDITPGEKSPNDIDFFVDKLVDFVMSFDPELSKQDAVRFVRNAERYFVADYQSNRTAVFESEIAGNHYIQYDEPIPIVLTPEDKQHWAQIHGHEQPSWFKDMSEWEQQWFVDHVPKNPDGDWSAFEKLYFSSAMQHVPGVKNARFNYLYREDEGVLVEVSKAAKTATLVPYEMVGDSTIKDFTRETSQSYVSFLQERSPTQRVFTQSLLGDTALASVVVKMDVKLAGYQMEVVNGMEGSIAGNEPVNFTRTKMVQSVPERWKYVDELIGLAEAEGMSERITVKDHEIILQAIDGLKQLREQGVKTGRNYNAFKSALVTILAEKLHIAVSVNCKSGKDRTGIDEVYHHSMLVFFDKNNRLPDYYKKADMKQFREIFASFFRSGKGMEAAAKNTPGSFGFKDTAMVIGKSEKKTFKSEHDASNKRSELNKPPLFVSDERLEATERSATSAKRLSNSLGPSASKKEKSRSLSSSAISMKLLRRQSSLSASSISLRSKVDSSGKPSSAPSKTVSDPTPIRVQKRTPNKPLSYSSRPKKSQMIVTKNPLLKSAEDKEDAKDSKDDVGDATPKRKGP